VRLPGRSDDGPAEDGLGDEATLAAPPGIVASLVALLAAEGAGGI
jgi:hypothetical protein